MTALVVALVPFVFAFGEAKAQTLPEAARRAAEERQKTGGPERVLTNRDLVGFEEWEITLTGLEQYAFARAALARVRQARPSLHTRLFDASRRVSCLVELAPALAEEPAVVEALESYGLKPHEFLRREQAFRVALAWRARAWSESAPSNHTRVANIEFVRHNETQVAWLERFIGQEEKGLSSLWYDITRFSDASACLPSASP